MPLTFGWVWTGRSSLDPHISITCTGDFVSWLGGFWVRRDHLYLYIHVYGFNGVTYYTLHLFSQALWALFTFLSNQFGYPLCIHFKIIDLWIMDNIFILFYTTNHAAFFFILRIEYLSWFPWSRPARK